jgi:hypothetical protein
MQELRCGARRASARSQRIGANNVGGANQRCTRATVTLLVLLLGLGFDDRLACWRAPGPYLSTTTTKASVGRKPQQPVISPAKKIRPGRCGAATLRLVAANAPTASNQSTSRMGGGCKVQWTPRPRSADRLADHHEHPRAGLCCAGSSGGRPLAGPDLRWAGSPAASWPTGPRPNTSFPGPSDAPKAGRLVLRGPRCLCSRATTTGQAFAVSGRLARSRAGVSIQSKGWRWRPLGGARLDREWGAMRGRG